MSFVKTFEQLKAAGQLLQEEIASSALMAVAETLQNIAYDKQAQSVDGKPSAQVIATLNTQYAAMDLDALPVNERRQAIQLFILDAMRTDKIEPNLQMTPDAIALMVGFIANVLFGKAQQVRLFDPCVGTGNLLYVVQHQLQDAGKSVHSIGSDNDDVLVSIAAMSSQLLGLNTRLLHQDSLQPLLIDTPDLVVSDLPIGYYPNDERAQVFATHAASGHSYAHHLLIEHSLQQLRPDGWGCFVVPSQLFESEMAPAFIQWLATGYDIQAILQLPSNLFKSQSMRKSILLIQKHGQHQRHETLIGDIPELKNTQKIQQFTQEFTTWASSVI